MLSYKANYYKVNYVIYLVVIGSTIAYFLGWFKFIMDFQLETFALLSVRNLIGIGLFFLAMKIFKRQVDYD